MKLCFRTLLSRFVLFSLLWLLLTEGAMSSWPVGLPVVLLAAFVSALMLPVTSWSLSGTFRFILFFLKAPFHQAKYAYEYLSIRLAS